MTSLDIVINAVDQASDTFEKVGDSGEKSAALLEQTWVKVGLATAGAAIALEAMARSQQGLTEDTNKLAHATGMTAAEVRDLTLEISNETFALEDVLTLMKLGHAEGLVGAEALGAYANFWDLVSDATGLSSVELAKGSSGLRAVGIAAGEEGKALDAFGYITQETKMEISDFLRILDRSGPELREMGMSIDDAAAMLGVMEKELGMSARTARTEFTSAVSAAGGDTKELFRILGISPEVFAKYQGAVKESSGVINEYARINNETFTVMQKLQHMGAELAYQFGDIAGAASAMAPALLAVGPAIKIFDMLKGAVGGAGGMMPLLTGGLAGAKVALAGVMTTLIPVLPILIALAAAAALLYLAWKTNFLGIQDVVAGAKDWIADRFEGIKTALEPVKEKLAEAFGRVKEAAGELFGKLDELFQKLSGGIGITELIGKAWEVLGAIMDAVWGKIGEVVIGAIDKIVDGITFVIDLIGRFIDALNRLAENKVVAFFLEKLARGVEMGTKALDSILPSIADVDKALVDQQEVLEDTKVAYDDLAGGVEEGTDKAGKAVEEMTLTVDEQAAAQIKQLELLQAEFIEAGLSAEEAAKLTANGVASAIQQLNNLKAATSTISGSGGRTTTTTPSTGGYDGGASDPRAVLNTGDTYGTPIYGFAPGQTGGTATPIGTKTYKINSDGTQTILSESIYPDYSGYTRIPGMAHGGKVLAGGRVLVGEDRPEEMYLPAGAVVGPIGKEEGVPLDIEKLATAIARAVGRPVTLHIHAGAFVGDKTAARQLLRYLDEVRIMEGARRGEDTRPGSGRGGV